MASVRYFQIHKKIYYQLNQINFFFKDYKAWSVFVLTKTTINFSFSNKARQSQQSHDTCNWVHGHQLDAHDPQSLKSRFCWLDCDRIEPWTKSWTWLLEIQENEHTEYSWTGSSRNKHFIEYKQAEMFSNVRNLCKSQLQSPCVQKMMRILEIIDSSYFPSFKALTEAVFDGKARDFPNTFN